MPVLKLLWYYLWIVPHLMQLGIAVIMLRRRLVRHFPWFFAYICFEVLAFSLLFTFRLVHNDAIPYFSLYVIAALLSTILRFGVILEILRQLAASYAVLDRLIKPLFRWITVGLFIAAMVFAIYTRGEYSDHSWFLLNMLNRTALILQTGLLAGLFLFSRYLTLSWRNQVFGIALGLGVYAVVDLIGAAIRSRTGAVHSGVLDYVSMAAYHGSVLIWMFYLLAPERKAQRDLHELPAPHEVEAWNEELERLLHQR